MGWQLRSYDVSPPGRYPYEQTQGIYHFFPATPYPEAQAQAVASFRQANNLPRATQAEALLDIGAYTCQRLGNMPAFCVNTDNPTVALNASSPVVDTGCRGCGAKLI